jgi:hypothetical protein
VALFPHSVLRRSPRHQLMHVHRNTLCTTCPSLISIIHRIVLHGFGIEHMPRRKNTGVHQYNRMCMHASAGSWTRDIQYKDVNEYDISPNPLTFWHLVVRKAGTEM